MEITHLYYLLADPTGQAVVIADETGQEVDHIFYDSLGEVIDRSLPPALAEILAGPLPPLPICSTMAPDLSDPKRFPSQREGHKRMKIS